VLTRGGYNPPKQITRHEKQAKNVGASLKAKEKAKEI
jgi:hypothetical protein